MSRLHGDDLPAKFTKSEREAYQWLWESDIRPWLVDLKTKDVHTPDGKVKSLVHYAKQKGMK